MKPGPGGAAVPPAWPAVVDQHPVVLFDGVCALCNWAVRFIVPRDPAGVFRFAPQQSALAADLLRAAGEDPARLESLDTMMLVRRRPAGDGLEVLDQSAAAFAILAVLPAPWRWLGVLRVLPRAVTDWAYRLLARSRYRLFGQYEACPLPDPAEAWRYLS